ncbi:hypothetical protein Y032_0239g3327 [Ancylostoma ceylanicum]|uniref:Uncharacterized protein n=1 Tax=Ancylostoma ceylanicum TaxID=53326 RepID=A0A016SE19_9BILA|nr:hypothetical protein Y032_0239g3327 [Ancylostoma ceylanicum]
MLPKTTRSTRSKLTGTQTTSITTRSVDASSQTPESDLMQMPLEGLVRYISEQNNDPLVGNLLEVLLHRLPKSSPLDLELDKRWRSIVISGLPEADGEVSFQDRRTHLDNQVSEVLEALKIECRPVELYRMGKLDLSRPRLVKVVLPSRFSWRTALANARFLRTAGFSDVYIRKSMTAEERKREYELRQTARERNRGKPQREWVVYRSQLVHISELPRNRSGNA